MGLLTCAALPSGDADEAHLIHALNQAGVQATWIPWSTTDPTALSADLDLLLLRSMWDYTDNYPAFMAWLTAVEVPIENSLATVRWNSDKRYLLELEAAGVPAIPTQIVENTHQVWQVPVEFEEFVVKPIIGAGSKGAKRFLVGDVELAQSHIESLIDFGSPVMVQPYMPSVDAGSETALVFIDGEFSHAVTKGPMLSRDGMRPMVGDLYVEETIDPREATDVQREVANRALAAIPPTVSAGPPLYARVDLIDDLAGDPMVLELELVEPSLFFSFDSDAADRLVAAVRARL